jgi:ABC-type nitrate/sulfonate/bicarbonate transport system ATPase subunit
MKAIKAKYKNGKVTLSEPPPCDEADEVLVIFQNDAEEPWDRILKDTSRRPKLEREIEKVKRQIARGETKPLRIEDL